MGAKSIKNKLWRKINNMNMDFKRKLPTPKEIKEIFENKNMIIDEAFLVEYLILNLLASGRKLRMVIPKFCTICLWILG